MQTTIIILFFVFIFLGAVYLVYIKHLFVETIFDLEDFYSKDDNKKVYLLYEDGFNLLDADKHPPTKEYLYKTMLDSYEKAPFFDKKKISVEKIPVLYYRVVGSIFTGIFLIFKLDYSYKDIEIDLYELGSENINGEIFQTIIFDTEDFGKVRIASQGVNSLSWANEKISLYIFVNQNTGEVEYRLNK